MNLYFSIMTSFTFKSTTRVCIFFENISRNLIFCFFFIGGIFYSSDDVCQIQSDELDFIKFWCSSKIRNKIWRKSRMYLTSILFYLTVFLLILPIYLLEKEAKYRIPINMTTFTIFKQSSKNNCFLIWVQGSKNYPNGRRLFFSVIM